MQEQRNAAQQAPQARVSFLTPGNLAGAVVPSRKQIKRVKPQHAEPRWGFGEGRGASGGDPNVCVCGGGGGVQCCYAQGWGVNVLSFSRYWKLMVNK